MTETEATAISTPLDKVPLYKVPIGELPITLLKSSHAASRSDLFSFGTPEMHKNIRNFYRLSVKDDLKL
jgi:hypothetical protein